MPDDLSGNAMVVTWVEWRLHAASLRLYAASLAGLQVACETRLP